MIFINKMENNKLDKQHTNHSYFFSLELEGVNCFKEMQTLDMSDGKGSFSPWTIILGDNGTGKTTLLKILERMQPGSEEIDFSRMYNDISYQNLKGYFFPRFLFEGLNLDYSGNSLDEIVKNKSIIKLSLVINEFVNTVIVDGQISRNGNLYFKEFSNVFLLSYGASRRMSKSQTLRTSISRYSSSLFDDSIELINAEEWFLQKSLKSLIAEKVTRKKYLNEFAIVKKLLIDILPNIEDIRIKPVNEENSKILLEVKSASTWINLRNLSYGYQTITALIVDIAANMIEQYSEIKKPLSEPVIILIDEIDLHLHPKWQRTVIEKLSHHFPKAQFIVTAHSPLIVQAAEDFKANIVVCRVEGDSMMIDNDIESVKGWRVDQILTSDLFDLSSSKSVETENLRNEKINLLISDSLTAKNKERLKEIDKALDNTPVFSDKESIDAETLIKKAAQLLNK
jgi:predicted ATP-binding protein involved in virulence